MDWDYTFAHEIGFLTCLHYALRFKITEQFTCDGDQET